MIKKGHLGNSKVILNIITDCTGNWLNCIQWCSSVGFKSFCKLETHFLQKCFLKSLFKSVVNPCLPDLGQGGVESLFMFLQTERLGQHVQYRQVLCLFCLFDKSCWGYFHPVNTICRIHGMPFIAIDLLFYVRKHSFLSYSCIHWTCF